MKTTIGHRPEVVQVLRTETVQVQFGGRTVSVVLDSYGRIDITFTRRDGRVQALIDPDDVDCGHDLEQEFEAQYGYRFDSYRQKLVLDLEDMHAAAHDAFPIRACLQEPCVTAVGIWTEPGRTLPVDDPQSGLSATGVRASSVAGAATGDSRGR